MTRLTLIVIEAVVTEWVKTRMEMAEKAAAMAATTARLSAAMAVVLLMPQMSCRPALPRLALVG